MGLFKMVFSTKGSFVKDARLRYDGRDVYALSGQYSYFSSFFEAYDLIKGIGSSFNIDDVKLWRKHEDGCLEKDLKPFINDKDATLLALYAEKSSFGVEIYIEQRLSSGEKTYMYRLIDKQKGHESVEKHECVRDSESNEDSLDDIHFEDSEEERMHDFDEDIGEGLNIGVDNGESRKELVNGVGIVQGEKESVYYS